MTPEDAAALEAMPFPLTVWRAYDAEPDFTLICASCIIAVPRLAGGSKGVAAMPRRKAAA